ncbi:Protein YobA [Halomonadaceae bacterium LMG 33818]|uniref:copper resistance CopC family protein n=1 Tax=Cernens ardua TaxID=3402176 RepID=UPI003EDBE56C
MLKFFVVLVGLVFSPLALAHAHLVASTPANNATFSQAPTSLELTFSEGVEVALSQLTLVDSHGHSIALGQLKANSAVKEAGDHRSYTVGLPALKTGEYSVQMNITSIDTHRVTDTLKFSIK